MIRSEHEHTSQHKQAVVIQDMNNNAEIEFDDVITTRSTTSLSLVESSSDIEGPVATAVHACAGEYFCIIYLITYSTQLSPLLGT